MRKVSRAEEQFSEINFRNASEKTAYDWNMATELARGLTHVVNEVRRGVGVGGHDVSSIAQGVGQGLGMAGHGIADVARGIGHGVADVAKGIGTGVSSLFDMGRHDVAGVGHSVANEIDRARHDVASVGHGIGTGIGDAAKAVVRPIDQTGDAVQKWTVEHPYESQAIPAAAVVPLLTGLAIKTHLENKEVRKQINKEKSEKSSNERNSSFNDRYAFEKTAKEEGEKGFKPPAGVQSAARHALKLIEEGKAGDGFTSVGRGRAHQLANGETLSLSTVKRMHSYFSRHRVDKKGKDWDNNSPGKVAWLAWGGDAGASWAAGICAKHDGKDKD